jgi:carbamoyl-phosphate synthase large subunit/carbamoyl-phosphate synthase small subunit
VLEDGTVYDGTMFGATKSVIGETVFNTGMVGYPESLTDPSYRGQILVLTYPLVGNYGVPDVHVRDGNGLLTHVESDDIQVAGVIVSSVMGEGQHSHWRATKSLHAWLRERNVPALQGIDTRSLTKKLRESGTMRGKIVMPEEAAAGGDAALSLAAAEAAARGEPLDLISQVSVKEPVVFEATGECRSAGGQVRLLAVDCGIKQNIVRMLCARGAQVTLVPHDYDFAVPMASGAYDGLFLSNGPGDPMQARAVVDNLRRVMSLPDSARRPIFGICMGNQLMALAAGGSTYKLPYGNRGHNQPAIDAFTGRGYITSQNHGYAVDANSLPAGWVETFYNANDGSNEGIAHVSRPYFSVQFHPEAKGGPVDTNYLFDGFVDMCTTYRDAAREAIEIARSRQADVSSRLDASVAAALPLAYAAIAAPPRRALIVNGGARHYSSSSSSAAAQSPIIADDGKAAQRRSYMTSAVHAMRDGAGSLAGVAAATAAAAAKSVFARTKSFVGERPVLPKKVLVLGSGGLSIGQAGEFDYSGSQAIKALKEEGIETVLINPNIATVQTAKDLADSVYSLPVTPQFVEDVIAKEQPDGILLAFGGQTALNCGVELYRSGALERAGVRVLGTPVQSIIDTEDRDLFARKLEQIDVTIARSVAVDTVDEAADAAAQIGYPIMLRSAYALGGLGSGIVANEGELRELAGRALASSPQVLVERSLKGWKEVEYEVVRDAYDNCCTVCNMENFDPLSIHTGESIVVAPSQTLSDAEYHKLREIAVRTVRHLGIVGECNIQYALDPHSEDYAVIEVNARLSRSSALASKATGYPLAAVAAKLALGTPLPEVRNAVTKTTTAFFEPSLDYIVCKVPRWDLRKFRNVSPLIGSAMKSVGEAMAIGRSFPETLQKALRMVDPAYAGFESTFCERWDDEQVRAELAAPTDRRVMAVARALERGWTVDAIHDVTKIDRWFLEQLAETHAISEALRRASPSLDALGEPLMRRAKELGFSDKQIGERLATPPLDELAVRARRLQLGVVPAVKQIDTLAAEFPASTNYLYMTYNARDDDVPFERDDRSVAVLGSGVYRIGSSVEFDYCGVEAIRSARKMGYKTIAINYNPETVSTDYDESDRLYFEELSLERIMDIYDKEQPRGVLVSVGGQIPQNLALPAQRAGLRVLGTDPRDIDRAEDRHKFSSLLDSIGVDQPAWAELSTVDAALEFAERVGYPLLVRPSYVLSGAAMTVVRNRAQLLAVVDSPERRALIGNDHPVVVSQFLDGAEEIEFDGVADGRGNLIAHAVCEHVERAGVHSGDATLVLPAPNLPESVQERVRVIGRKVAAGLNICGPFNMQVLRDASDNLKVIECNLRASRSLPFVSKTLDVPFVDMATRAMLQADIGALDDAPMIHSSADEASVAPAHFGVKAPQFSFQRLTGADPILGVEMASTGEVATFSTDYREAYLKSLVAARFQLPVPAADRLIYVHAGSASESYGDEIRDTVALLRQRGFRVAVSPFTARFLGDESAYDAVAVHRDAVDAISQPPVLVASADGEASFTKPASPYQLVINLENDHMLPDYQENADLRRATVDYSVPLITNTQQAHLLAQALSTVDTFTISSWRESFASPDNIIGSSASRILQQ